MKATDFVTTLRKIAADYKTLYVYGAIGGHLRSDNIDRYLNKYAYNLKSDRLAKIKDNLDQNVFGFDCVCLIKSILWGWNADPDANYGGAVYKSNSVPDVGANKMIELCLDVSEDFSDISVGELLWIKDHCGVYVGDGLVVECTPIWKDGVQFTALGNLDAPPTGYNQRKWTKHGKLPFVDYTEKSNEADITDTTTNSTNFTQNKPPLIEILRRILDLIIAFFKG